MINVTKQLFSYPPRHQNDINYNKMKTITYPTKVKSLKHIKNHIALSNTCSLGIWRGPPSQKWCAVVFSWDFEKRNHRNSVFVMAVQSQTIGATPKMKRGRGRKRRDKEAFKLRDWPGGGGSLPCQLCFKHLQQAELSCADVFALTRWYLQMTLVWKLNEMCEQTNLSFQDIFLTWMCERWQKSW